ncbi:FimV/HubP family polar landmark protein [Psychrobacter sp. ANT_WB68]|uniref:FimV/HubP family polar landmark protein n=1 Tax=Psychrobacter sp. ANT_WB68 TaxID=2597355 RepID=UPI0011F2F2EF|nr:FimV/HubP family polar landmark protein [Psychrobacter sp. ANT_WB68]KAA0914228.1 pilus assembly protein FimV [Psychrobacter sp. ANT_WB68]
MDNMLYIIAGLVFIVLIAVLVIRKNKAQKPSEQPLIKAGKSALGEASTQANTNTDKKFNHIEIAQRFMDQQRYDKAIETLNRGLTEIPNDSQLSLKLLAVYATIDQSDNFNKVYDSIKAHADTKSIAQADELKALLTEEQNQAAKYAQPADNGQDTGFESIDFDISTKKVATHRSDVDDNVGQPTAYKSDLTDSSDNILATSNDFDNIEQDFDLSLSDLEAFNNEPTSTSITPVTELDIADDENLSALTVTSGNDNSSSNSDLDLDLDLDLDFDFDLAEPLDTSTEASTTTLSNDASNDITLANNEDFVLDLADLENEAIDENVTVNNEVATEATSLEPQDMVLSLDTIDDSNAADTLAEAETKPSSEAPVLIEDNFDDFTFEDNAFEDDVEAFSFEEPNTAENEANETHHETVDSNIAPTTVTFDDNTLIDDDFDFDALSSAPIAITPVDLESGVESDIAAETEIETAEDFSSRFAADFDFVKTLDSNQVTLDLAGQYVQLGEYDSAKRLLNEVISQGTSEQQNQAQVLLDRTA